MFRLSLVLALGLPCFAMAQVAPDAAQPAKPPMVTALPDSQGVQDSLSEALRDPAKVAVPAHIRAQLRLGSQAPYDKFAATFDAMASRGAIFIAGPGTTPAIVAAADRARVYLGYLQYDLNGDGRVLRAEFDDHADVTWGTDLTEAERAILQREWEAADRDGNGAVTLDEVQAVALRMTPVPDQAPLSEIAQAIMGMDLDNDSFIRWEEVEAVLKAQE
ncbi:MAG: hypothetical protein ACRBCL_09110 [Maritimibacter sp.]